jgi:8-oxo-dGTP diphosphatase
VTEAPRAQSPLVDVVAAVIQRPDGRFLLAQRPPGKVYAGYWEFPGGKVEPQEPLEHALARELHEELGIDARHPYPWIVQRYRYPHAHVQLHFFRVLAWDGEPHPKEDQGLAWAALDHLGVSPLLPANGPVLRALALPAQLAITHAQDSGLAQFLPRLDSALARGLRLLMVREKTMPAASLAEFAGTVTQRAHAAGARVVLNAAPGLALSCGADGVHLPAHALLHAPVRPALPLCGASCHDALELAAAERLGCDYAVLGPVRPTASHAGHPGMGWERFAALVRGCTIPVYAIGGMVPGLLERSWTAGAHGIAMMRAAW